MRFGPVAAEIDARCKGAAGGFECAQGKAFTVHPEARAVGVNEKPAGGHDGNAEAQFAQRGDEEIAPRLEFSPSLLEDRQRVLLETREGGPLRWRGRRDVEVLCKLLEVANVPLGRDQPPKPPAGHVEILREAADDEDIPLERERAPR